METKVNSPFLTTREAARYLRMRPSTMERWRSAARGPRYRKIGGRVVYTQEDLEAFADAGLRLSTSDEDESAGTPARVDLEASKAEIASRGDA